MVLSSGQIGLSGESGWPVHVFLLLSASRNTTQRNPWPGWISSIAIENDT